MTINALVIGAIAVMAFLCGSQLGSWLTARKLTRVYLDLLEENYRDGFCDGSSERCVLQKVSK